MTIKSQEFHAAMFGIYQRAKADVGYNATRFLQMLDENGGLETAQILLHASGVSEGYTALWERGRLDLTVEALVIDPEWRELFTPEELHVARKRLTDYEYDFDRASRTAEA
jgi:hypothetical protein